VAVSGDGNRVLTGSYDETAILWDGKTGQLLHTCRHTGWVVSVALSSDGTRILTGSWDGSTILWDGQTGQKLKTFPGGESAALSSDASRVLTRSGNGPVVLCDAKSGQQLQVFQGGHTKTIWSVAMSSLTSRVLTGSADQTAILWNTKTGQSQHVFKGHTAGVTGVALASDGTLALTGAEDGNAILWDSKSGQKRHVLQGHTEAVTSVALSSDGSRVLTGSADGTTRLWDAQSGVELAALLSFDAGSAWLVITPDGLFDGSAEGTKLVSYRIADTDTLLPLERFYDTYYTPGLLAKLMAGERPTAKVNIKSALPPRVRIVSPAAEYSEAKAKQVEVTVEAESVGDFPVTKLTLFLDDVPLRDRAHKIVEPKLGKRTVSWTVELEPGNHTLKVMADNALTAASEVKHVRYLGGGTATVELPKLYVLLVGISDYGEAKYHLPAAAKDAAKLGKAYAALQGKLYSQVEVKTLTDKQATRLEILKGLEWLRKNMTQHSYGVFYFGGHGIKGEDGKLYLAGGDIDFQEVAASGLWSGQVSDKLKGTPGRLTVMLDCCHAGATGNDAKTRDANDLTLDVLRDLTREQSGIVTMCAALGSEKAIDGVFAQALLEALAGAPVEIATEKGKQQLKVDTNDDGLIYMKELDVFVTERVRLLSRGQQHATISVPIGFADYPVSKR
jgi:WD40 repeat protein